MGEGRWLLSSAAVGGTGFWGLLPGKGEVLADGLRALYYLRDPLGGGVSREKMEVRTRSGLSSCVP